MKNIQGLSTFGTDLVKFTTILLKKMVRSLLVSIRKSQELTH